MIEQVEVEEKYQSLILEDSFHYYKNEIAILAKIFQYFGFPDVYHILRYLSNDTCPGDHQSWWELIEMAKQFGFEGQGVKIEITQFQTLKEFTPLVSLYAFPELGVVNVLVYKITEKDIYFIYDYSGVGYKVSIEEFDNHWQGLVLLLLPGADAFQTVDAKRLIQQFPANPTTRRKHKIDTEEVRSLLTSKSPIPYFSQLLDLVIVGGGPGGVYCAAHAQLKNLSFKVLEKGKCLNSLRDFPVNMNFAGGDLKSQQLLSNELIPPTKRPPNHYIEYFERIIEDYQIEIHEDEAVENVKKKNDVFQVQTASHIYLSRYVIIASGYYDNPRQLDALGEKLPDEATRFSEIYKNAKAYKGKTVAIIGFGISAISLADCLYRNQAKVIILYRGKQKKLDNLKRVDNRNIIDEDALRNVYRLIKKGEISFWSGVKLGAIKSGAVEFKKQDKLYTLPCDHVFPMIGFNPEISHFKGTNLAIPSNCFIPAFNPRTMETSINNLFLCGTVAGNSGLNLMYHQAKKIIDLISE